MDGLAESLGTLALTIAIELAVVGAIQRRDWRAVAVAVVLVNLATQPAANAIYRGGVGAWLLIELAVVGIEAVLYCVALPVGWWQAFALALAANAASAGVGLLLFR